MSTRQCYYPNHQPATGTYPCSAADVTHCCGSSAICLSNGYCMDLAQPFTLSRGGCTSDTWAAGCPTECSQSIFASGGSSIVNIFYNSTTGVSDYCCGTPIAASDGSTVCQYNQPSFTLPQASILPGYAALEGYTNTASSGNTSTSPTATASTSTSNSADNSRDIALGAGLGIPLGLIALGSLVWGYYERRRANQFRKALTASSVPTQSVLAPKTPRSRYTTESSAPTELDGQQRFAELQGSHR